LSKCGHGGTAGHPHTPNQQRLTAPSPHSYSFFTNLHLKNSWNLLS